MPSKSVPHTTIVLAFRLQSQCVWLQKLQTNLLTKEKEIKGKKKLEMNDEFEPIEPQDSYVLHWKLKSILNR